MPLLLICIYKFVWIKLPSCSSFFLTSASFLHLLHGKTASHSCSGGPDWGGGHQVAWLSFWSMSAGRTHGDIAGGGRAAWSAALLAEEERCLVKQARHRGTVVMASWIRRQLVLPLRRLLPTLHLVGLLDLLLMPAAELGILWSLDISKIKW